jgi:hypothetical protein
MLARFSVPVSINGHLRLRAPQATSPQGFAGTPGEGRLTIESATTNTASSQGTISGTVMTTSGTVIGAWAAGQVLSVAGVTTGAVVTSVSGTGPYTVNLDTSLATVSTAAAMTGTPVIWNIDNSSGLFRIFREDWKTDTTYGGGPNGLVRLAITNAGNVGIGTTSPTAPLSVNGAAADVYIDRPVNTADGSLILRGGPTTATSGMFVARGSGGTYNVGGVEIYTNGAERLRITSAGNVGIGTTSPSTTLHVVGNTTLNGDITHSGTGKRFYADWTSSSQSDRLTLVTSTANGSTLIEVTPNGTGTASGINFCNAVDSLNTAIIRIGLDASSGYVTSSKRGTGSYFPMTFHTSDIERIRITTAGNVGIGTTDPKATLHANGTFAITTATSGTANSVILTAANYALPDATTCSGRMYWVKNTGASAIAMTSAGGTIDGVTSKTLNQYDCYTVISNGTNWFVI